MQEPSHRCLISSCTTPEQAIALAQTQATAFLSEIADIYAQFSPSNKVRHIQNLLGEIEELKIQNADNICSVILEKLSNEILSAAFKDTTIDFKNIRLNSLPKTKDGKFEVFSAQFPDLFSAINDYLNNKNAASMRTSYHH